MTEPIRVIHTGDLHLGKVSCDDSARSRTVIDGGISRLKNFEAIVDYGIENDADAMIIAGDVFDHRSPSQTTQRDFYEILKRFSASAPVVIVGGNHDMLVDPTRASAICMPEIFGMQNVYVAEHDAIIKLETKRGPIQVACLPYPQRKRLLTRVGASDRTISDLDTMLREAVIACINGMADELDRTIPSVLAAHLFVAGATIGNSPPVVFGTDVVVGAYDLAMPPFDYVALGHIHKHQQVGYSYPAVVYSGGIERGDFGEEHDAKGFCWFEVGKGTTTWRFVELDALRYVTIDCDVTTSDNPTAETGDLMAAALELMAEDYDEE